jgi:peptide/nickel transport system substrate-binding protein
MSKKLLNLLLVVMMLAVLVPTVSAAPLAQEGGQDYVVVADDWLSKLAEKYLGNPLAYPAIAEYTNRKNAEDASYAQITDPDVIEVGWKIYIPSVAEAKAYMEAPMAAEPSGEPKRGGTLVFGMRDEPPGFDPQASSLYVVKVTCDQLYNRLVEFNQEMEVVPALAESWEQPDETTLVFHLREGVKFHDGSEMTAEDVKFTLDRVVAEETASPWKTLFACIDEVMVEDPLTAVLKLNAPCGPILLGSLAHVSASILPKDYVESGGDLLQNPVGTGPFKMVSWSPTEFELVRNDDFWIDGLPYLDGLKIVIQPDENARAAALRSGAVDFLHHAPHPFIDIFQDEGFKVVSDPVGNFRYLVLNVAREPLDDWRVRQAIAWAIDREEVLTAAVNARAVPLDGGPIPSPHWAALPEPFFHQDYDKAKQLLQDAGHADGFKLPFQTLGSWDVHVRASEVIKEQLAPLGIDVEIIPQEDAVHRETRANSDFDAFVLGASGQVDPSQFMDRFREGGAISNWSQWTDEDFEALAEQGALASDQGERQQIYWEAQRYLCEQSPVVFLYAPNYYDVLKPEVKGYDHMLFSWEYHLVRNIWLDR